MRARTHRRAGKANTAVHSNHNRCNAWSSFTCPASVRTAARGERALVAPRTSRHSTCHAGRPWPVGPTPASPPQDYIAAKMRLAHKRLLLHVPVLLCSSAARVRRKLWMQLRWHGHVWNQQPYNSPLARAPVHTV